MSKAGEDGVIRLSAKQKAKLKVNPGAELSLSTESGGKLSVVVADAHSAEAAKERGASWVSQHTFDLVVGNPTDPDIVTLGCDPEFVFIDSRGQVMPANYWLPTKGLVGSDGPLAELRPSPAEHEREVVENLRKLIHCLPVLMEHQFGGTSQVTMEGHSCWQNYALGFHIHIGAPREITTGAAVASKEFVRSFITALDYFVGIPAMLLEDTNLRRLGNGMYGKPGDFRITNRTVEYRTPGGFHLRHPNYAAGVMGLALCVSREIFEDARSESLNWRELNKCAGFSLFQKKYDLPSKSSIRWALSEPTKKAAVAMLPNLIERLRRLRYFHEHEESIRGYFSVMAENKQYSPRLLDNW